MNLKTFYKQSPQEIVNLFRKFIEDDLLSQYPDLEDKVSFVLTGSVPSAHYDQFSDIDCDILFENESDGAMIKEVMKLYKVTVRERKLPIQLHTPMTFRELHDLLGDWKHDAKLREHARALIVLDPADRYKTVHAQIRWYPKDVLSEKINWLFAESVFAFEDRLAVAVKRQNNLYVRSLALQILTRLGNALIMINERYPVFEKHLYSTLRELGENEFCNQIDSFLAQTDASEIEQSVTAMINGVELRLIKAGFIDKQTKEYWIQLRPKYQVEGCI